MKRIVESKRWWHRQWRTSFDSNNDRTTGIQLRKHKKKQRKGPIYTIHQWLESKHHNIRSYHMVSIIVLDCMTLRCTNLLIMPCRQIYGGAARSLLMIAIWQIIANLKITVQITISSHYDVTLWAIYISLLWRDLRSDILMRLQNLLPNK